MRTLPLVLTLAACTTSLEPGFEVELDRAGACVDLIVFASNADDTQQLVFRTSEVLSSLTPGDTTASFTYDFEGEDGTLVAEVGTKVSDLTCDDAQSGAGPDVQARYAARSGTATLDVTRVGEQITIDLEVANVELVEQISGFQRAELPSWSLTGLVHGAEIPEIEATEDPSDAAE